MSTRAAAPPRPEPGAGGRFAPLRRLRRVRLETAVTLLALVLVWSGVLGYLGHQRNRVEAEAYQTASDLARGFGESVSRTLEAMDQVFAMLRAFHRADPERFDLQALAPRGQVPPPEPPGPGDAWHALSAREREVAIALVGGATQPEIARKLGRSAHTIGTLTRRIYRKLGIRRRAELVNRLRIVDGPAVA